MRIRLKELMAEKTAREKLAKPFTQDDLAVAVNVPQGTISRWVNDKVDRLDKNILVKLCLYFNCDIGDLLVFEREDFLVR